MKKMFLLLGLLHIIMAIYIFIQPTHSFLVDQDNFNSAILKLYSIGLFSLGIIAIQVYKYFSYSPLIKMICLVFFIFHALVSFHLYAIFKEGILSNLWPSLLYLLISIIIISFYYRAKAKFIL